MPNALRFLDTITLLGLPHLTPARLLPVEALLRERGYDNARVRDAILDHLDSGRGVETCEGLAAEDREAVAGLLHPEVECWDGCAQCAEDAAVRHGLLKPTTR